eukprot:3239118-Alexandrium_andersonii.AAC.1
MSASLVGSEMCIRDRITILQALRPAHLLMAWIMRHESMKTRMCVQGPAPVSYTHLTLPTICSV